MGYDQQEVGMLGKKERKALKRQQKIEEQLRKAKKRTIRRLVVWALIIFGLLGIVFGMVIMASKPPPEGGSSSSSVGTVADTEWTKGNSDAKLVLVEYSDFQCPACGSYYPILKQLNEEFENDILFIYRHFPLKQIHKNAELAGIAAEAGGMQGNFWGMHDMIFENQDKWSGASDAEEYFIEYAEFLGLDIAKFKEGIDSRGLRAEVEKDYQGGIKAGVNSTPTFFINGKRIQNPRSYGEFKTIITEALRENS